MDGLSHALDEALLKELKCVECREYMVPPIKMCYKGHNICSKCTRRVYKCPNCGDKIPDITNVALESIARRLMYPCANRQSGCLDLFSIEHFAEHKAVCTYGPIKCPLNKANVQCSWTDLISNLKEHAKGAHPIYFLEGPTFFSDCLFNEIRLVFCFGEVFLYKKQIRDGTFYCVVQLIGPSSQACKFKCKFKLLAANKIEQISKTFTVRSYEEDFEPIFSSWKGFRLGEVEVRNFVVNKKLNLTITLSKV